MIDGFLKAKHWQLFILIFGLPFLLQVIIGIMIIDRIEYDSDPENHMSPVLPIMFAFAMFLLLVMRFCWYWSVGVGLQRSVPAEANLRVGRFKFAFLAQLVHMVAVMAIIAISVGIEEMKATGFIILIPMQLFYLCCMFYTFYFMAKTVKSAETQRNTTFGDYAAEFFLILVLPIGIWFVQPKINKLVSERGDQN